MSVQGPLCGGCPLEHKGEIFIPFTGLGTNRVMLVLDSGWKWEAQNVRIVNAQRVGTPLSGPSGWFVERNLGRIGAARQEFIIANTYWCKAPHLGYTDHPERYPDAAIALQHCRPYLDELIERTQPKVIVPMGNVALRRITGLTGIERHNAYYVPTPYGIPAIPTFHPSYILQGNQKLSAVWCMAVSRALELANGRAKLAEYRLLLDPSLAEARDYLAQIHNLEECKWVGLGPLVCDIETPEADEDEDEREDSSYTIVRISFSNWRGTAISMPWQPPYIDLIKWVLNDPAREVVFWNQGFDLPRLRANGCAVPGRVVDAMFAWHFLQSDLPKALGFVAPLHLLLEPWKHLSTQEPARYSALDSAITMDVYLAVKAQLEREGRWQAFERHCVRMFPILQRMSDAGVKLDLEHQAGMKARLEHERDAKMAELQAKVPDAVKPLVRWKKKGPQKREEWPDLRQLEDGSWSAHKPFNPGSSDQVIELVKYLGLPVPKAKGEDRETTEAKHLKRLAKKNAIFRDILSYREHAKIIDSYIWKVGADGRVHTTFSFHPSTWRKSSRNPNVQTVPKRNDLAADFRRCVVASAGHVLVECDSAAIEAVLVGFFAGSERYIDLAKRGVHKWLATEYAGRPVTKEEPLYDQIKRVVHLSNYVGTPQRIHEEYPDVFASVAEARKLQEFYFSTPAGQDVKAWQQRVMEQAHHQRYLENPWKYRHYFYTVFQKREGEWVLGDDAKRAVACLPQSTASAIQTEYILDIEDNHSWMTPYLRWLIHDAILSEVPKAKGEEFAWEMKALMERPFPELDGLSIGAEAKVGHNLRDMKVIE